MVKAVENQDGDVVLRFGAGINSRASEDEIDDSECAVGQNFALDIDNRTFRRRPPFDLVDTATNAEQINGFAQLVKQDGTTSTLVQAGTTVYEWDGNGTFTSRGTVASGTKIRGRLEHNWTLDEKVLITDLALQNVCLEWDGTTLSTMSENLTGNFLAKYCFVADERAYFANVISNSVATPHLIAISEVEDYSVMDISNKPTLALGDSDPTYILSPDLKPINGIQEAFGLVVFSTATKQGRTWKLTGTTAKDFAVRGLHPDSSASGNESMVFIGNDIAYGRAGRIETLLRTDQFGDVATDDISRPILPEIDGYADWTSVYNARTQLVYFFADEIGECWVLDKSMLDEQTRISAAKTLTGKRTVSPWIKYTTTHALGFRPTAVMNFYDPQDGLEYVFMGDASGNIYRMEGVGSSGDGGTETIISNRTSKSFSLPLDAQAFKVDGWVKYRNDVSYTMTISLLWSGSSLIDERVEVQAEGIGTRPYYSSGIYYADGNYYSGVFGQRFVRLPFGVNGKSEEFQIRVEVDSTVEFDIAEIGLRFEAAS